MTLTMGTIDLRYETNLIVEEYTIMESVCLMISSRILELDD